jgi:hypothetical protein
MDTPSIRPTFDLAGALVDLRDHAHDLAERLKALWIDPAQTDDRIAADDLDPLVGMAMTFAAHIDAVQHRVTDGPMTTVIGSQIESLKRARGEWPIV